MALSGVARETGRCIARSLRKEGWSDGRRGKKRGTEGPHKNVQEAWLYIRAVEILLAKQERGETREESGETESRWQLPITSRRGDCRKTMSGGVAVDGRRGVDGFVRACVCIVHYSHTLNTS